MRTLHRFSIGLFLVMLIPIPALAEGNIHAGLLKINPFVSVSETFSDNIYYTSTDERSDSITATTPGVRLQYPFHVHNAELEYYSVLTRYRRYREEDTTDSIGKGAIDLKFGGLVRLRLSEDYSNGHEPRNASSTGFIEIYRNNVASASVTYQLADVSKVQVDYAKTIWRFKTSDFRNRDEDLVSGYFFYRFLSKTSAFIEYDRKNVAFSQTALELDNKVDAWQVGLTWEISARSRGTVKGGTINKDFTSPTQKDFKGWTGYADVRHDFSEYTSVLLNGQRAVNESSIQDNRYLITTGAYGELTHRFVKRLAVVVKGSYGEDQYSDPIPPDTTVRVDRTLFEGLGLKYTVRDWLELSVDYGRRARRSNIPVNNYTEHSTILTANISL